MSAEFIPAVPPGWTVGRGGDGLTLTEWHIRYGHTKREPLFICDPLGNWHLVRVRSDVEITDTLLAKIIAVGIVPPVGVDYWTEHDLRLVFNSLPAQQRALVAPRPTEEGQRKIRLEATKIALRAAKAALDTMNVVLTTQGWFGHAHAPIAEFTRLHQTAAEGVHDAIKAATGEREDLSVAGQRHHAEGVGMTGVLVA